MTTLFDKFQQLAATRQALAETGIDFLGTVMERVVSATEAIVNGRPTILAGTNNYLGLTFDSECIDAARKALTDEGTGTTGSRMANGTYSGHISLERELAEFYGARSAIVFSTGYVANLGMLSSLTGPGDVLLIDADCHASIYDGCRLSGADVLRFKHNDVNDLEKRLRRLGDRATRCLIVIEGLYSMLGDRARLADIGALKQDYGACLMIDEAHSLGVLGEHGRGLAEEVGAEDRVDFVVGTFSKSLGTIGGFCVSDHPELELIRYASKPYIFTASPSPAIIASTRKALEILRSRPGLRTRLWNNAHQLYNGLRDMGFVLGPEPSPIVAVRLESKDQALILWHRLLEGGVYVNLVLPPATPDGGSLLRISMSAAHTPEHVNHICEEFASLREAVDAAHSA
ncbi:MAG: aminotransferase class I/II-fold pyridoxal phosphate-dependent enzyme [Deltaproteobacteria bacterium]|nr:aminotransferase class I/II-fold pyridoxal phosphate-dependent enzyme [Deltaproteobacteria bacterium]